MIRVADPRACLSERVHPDARFVASPGLRQAFNIRARREEARERPRGVRAPVLDEEYFGARDALEIGRHAGRARDDARFLVVNGLECRRAVS